MGSSTPRHNDVKPELAVSVFLGCPHPNKDGRKNMVLVIIEPRVVAHGRVFEGR